MYTLKRLGCKPYIIDRALKELDDDKKLWGVVDKTQEFIKFLKEELNKKPTTVITN